MNPVRWKLWYADASSYSNLDGPWSSAPSRGVSVLVTMNPVVGREVGNGFDYYLWWPGQPEPSGVDAAGLWDFLREIEAPFANERLENRHFVHLEGLGVKFGRTIATDAFAAIVRMATEDEEMPRW